MSPRYVLAHVLYLPLESATVAAMRGSSKYRGWSEEMYMLASTLDAVRLLLWTTIMANKDPNKPKPPVPEPYPTPDRLLRRGGNKAHKPGSFAFIAKQHAAAIRAKRKAAQNG